MPLLTEYNAAVDADFRSMISMALLKEAWNQVASIPSVPDPSQTRAIKLATALIKAGATTDGLSLSIASLAASQGLSKSSTESAIQNSLSTQWGRLAAIFDPNVGA